MDYRNYIMTIEGFPREGISFKDISPLLADHEAFSSCIDDLARLALPYKPDLVMGAESRGFVFGAALAYKMGLGFVMARKPGKLPGKNIRAEYELEYGTDALEVREGLIAKGARILLVDDLIATGGSMEAMERLTKLAGALPVACLAVIGLKDLGGASRLDIPCKTLLDL